jgi:hypothetical protein
LNMTQVWKRGVIVKDKEAFRKWLCTEVGLQNRSAGNVVSRLKRAQNFVNVFDDVCDNDELIFKMTRNPDFKSLTNTVQSQLKRAVLLYREFQSQCS